MSKTTTTKDQIKQSYQAMRKALGEGSMITTAKMAQASQEPISIEDEIARREKIKNDELEQDRKLKKLSLILLFVFLAGETGFIFWIAYQQGLNNEFKLEEWSFKLLITATIAQITLMLQIAIKYLFAKKK